MVRILALDPASHFGWTVIDDGKYTFGGMEEFKFPTKAKKNKHIGKGKKWHDAYTWLNAQVVLFKPDYIVCEDVKRHTSTLAAHSYGFLRYASEAAAYSADVPFFPIGVGVWKNIAITNGGADKDEIQEAMSVHYPNVVWITDDHSDAAGIGYAFHHILTTTPEQLETLLLAAGGKKKKEPKPKKERKSKKS